MAANFYLVIAALVAVFGIFMIGLGYGSWSTRNIVAPGARDHRD